jgi:hypothetical protein
MRKERLCRKHLSSAVNDAARSINAQQAGSGDWIYDIYQSAIDFGAHPNPRSILLHLNFSPDEGDAYHRLNFVGL